MVLPDFYAALQVSEKVTAEEVKTAYRHLARQYHPDHNPGQEDRFRAIHEAYRVLSDPQKRRDYDLSRQMYRNGGQAMEDFGAVRVQASGKELGRLVREVLRQGNMTRIKLRYQGEELLDLPLASVAVLGGGALLVSPLLAVAAGVGLSRMFQVEVKNKLMEDFEEASRLHEAMRLKEAKALYLKVLDRSDFFLPAFLQLGQLYRQLGESEAAAAMFNRVLEIMPIGEVAELAREQLRQVRGF